MIGWCILDPGLSFDLLGMDMSIGSDSSSPSLILPSVPQRYLVVARSVLK